jgi:mono/diheme cytochrome c family protein
LPCDDHGATAKEFEESIVIDLRRLPLRRKSAAQVLIPALATVFAGSLTSCASAPDGGAAAAEGPARSQEARVVEQGERLYQISCSGCHGANARGNGPETPHLAAAPPDLTLIASRRGGSFPLDEVYRIIDGQADLTAHGPRHMPVWGYDFFGEDPDDEAAHREATEKLERLLRFLQSIQRTG